MWILIPSRRRLRDEYFTTAHCIISIPRKKSPNEKPLDERLREDIREKFKPYPGYEGIIEIPNDRTPAETKSTTFHESLHYLMARYNAETGRNFVNAFIREDLSPLEKYQAEHLLDERAVEILTDKLLVHDSRAQFENRWLHYSGRSDSFGMAISMVSALTTGLLLGSALAQPYLLPLTIMPGRIRDYILKQHKQAKREELLQPIEYPQFQI